MADEDGQSVQEAPGRPRFGAFALGVRDSTYAQQGTVIAVHATGVAGTAYAGYEATCYCRPVAEEDASEIIATPWFSQAQTVRHDRLTPVIDAGVAGQTAYFVELATSGERVSQRLRNQTETTPAQVGRILADILEGVNVAWQAGYDLVVSPDTVRILVSGQAQVSLALSMCKNPKPGPGSDAAAQFQLASLAVMLHSGQADQSSLGIDQLNGPDRVAVLSRFREQMGNLAEHVAVVLAKALDGDPEQRYATTQAFVAAYDEALNATADELAFSAIEAKNRDNGGMASVYSELIKRYNEKHPELVGLGGRLSPGYQAASASSLPPQPPVVTPMSDSPAAAPSPQQPYASVGSETQLTPEIVAMLTGPTHQVTKPKTNPWFTFAAGTVFILAVFMFLAFLVMANS
jgi:hypothetical protein